MKRVSRKEPAIITEIDGWVEFGKDTKGKRKVIVRPEIGEPKEYLIPKGKPLGSRQGDRVQAGEALMDGAANPHDILKVLGDKELAKFLVDNIQEVYRLQGVRINDKHVEVIVRQMLRRVKIKTWATRTSSSTSRWKNGFSKKKTRVLNLGGRPAVAEPLLLGITKASLSTESFISASSFPGDHEGSDRGCSIWQDRLSSWFEGECHYGSSDSLPEQACLGIVNCLWKLTVWTNDEDLADGERRNPSTIVQ